MINCILKLLGISLTQGYDTFWTWSILVVPLALGLLFLLIKSIRGASGYYDVGRTHAIAGWILVVAGILCYVAVALWSDSIRMDYKLRVIRNVQDHTPGVETRRLAMLVESGKTVNRISEALDAEKTQALLRAVQEQIDKAEDEDQREAFEAVINDYIDSIPGAQAKIKELAKTAATLLEATIRSVKEDELRKILVSSLQAGDISSAVKKAIREWFLTLDFDSRRPLEEACFRTGNATEIDSREIAYRTGYGIRALPAIRFFVFAKEWLRGLLSVIVIVFLGFYWVACGSRIKRRSRQYEKNEQAIREKACAVSAS